MLRLVGLLLVLLTLLYAVLWLLGRARRRARLEALWEENGRPGDLQDFLRRAQPDGAPRGRLLLWVYGVPLALVALIVYLVNYA